MSTPPQQHSPTIEGAILGTAAYMSPEQARGRRVDKRSDIWTFGVLLYEMLTGASPFVGETASDSIGAVLHKELDLGSLPSETPLQARRVLKLCLVRDMNQRIRDIGDARLELIRPVESAPHAQPSRRGVPLALLALACVLVACLAATGAWLLKPVPHPERMHLAIPAAARFERVPTSRCRRTARRSRSSPSSGCRERTARSRPCTFVVGTIERSASSRARIGPGLGRRARPRSSHRMVVGFWSRYEMLFARDPRYGRYRSPADLRASSTTSPRLEASASTTASSPMTS